MCSIKLLPIMSGRTYPDAGALLYDRIAPILDTEDSIILDLEGVDLLPSMFLNVSIGRIIKEHGLQAIKKISFRNITKSQVQRIKNYIDKVQ